MADPASAGLSHDRMQALLAYSWDILSLLDGEGRLIYNSPAAQRLHGFSPEEMDGRSTFEFFHQEDAPRVGEAFQACLAQPGQPVRVEYRYARKDGSWIWMEAVAVNLLDTPSVQAIVVNSRDISERVAAQQALRDSERFADRILDALRHNLTVLDGEGRILKVNGAWQDFASANGLPAGFPWEGVNYLDVCARATGADADTAQAMAEGMKAVLLGGLPEFTLEYPCHSPGQQRWFQALVTPFQGLGPARLVVSHLDITSLRKAEENRLQLERQLQRSQKMESLGSLAGGVAHDMNNVLGSILGMASMHQELHPADSPAQQAFSIIARACQRGGGLVRRLLDFARQDLTETKVVDLNILLQEEVLLLERTTLGRVQCTTELAPQLPFIRGDSSALVHAVMNLCLNAVDAMPEGGELHLRTRPGHRGWVELEVEDTGTGMPSEVLERAMDPFFTTKPPDKGTGLGLSIVYSTVNAHQGTMELHSEPGKGTRVTLRFPTIDFTVVEETPPPLGGLGETARPMDILLVDDDELIRATLGPVIRCLGHRVTLAFSGEEALGRLAAGKVPQVIILDMNMPGLGGQGTLPLLRDRHPDLPVFLATGRVDQAALELARTYPGVTLIPKPFSMRDLKEHLDAVAARLKT
ncbi:MAG: PAS domain S-box protein [Geothrix sp.]|uniref:hybrid sensor histidine kinase/response regulator n=1 Tax=Geothrix sp. TaxID=1962974 RepID=UPI0017A627BF|nr:PAS domain S-box protein [Geothrix sp.]NWJ40928.1 PAS domain S-box protein [Geothrix sp.]WIL21072.1 MAG: PAS domain S-box protein [Geothrix sp.]